MLQQWKTRAHAIKRDTLALYLALRHPDTPWYARMLAGCVVAYALSPIDLIPDFIPLLGQLDDLLLLPLGIALTVRLIPAYVLHECRQQASSTFASGKPTSRIAALVIVGLWLALAVLSGWLVWGAFQG